MKFTLPFVLGLSLVVPSSAELLRDVLAGRSLSVALVVGQGGGTPNSACFDGGSCPDYNCMYDPGTNPPMCKSADDYWFADQYVCSYSPGSWCSLWAFGPCYDYAYCTPMYGTSGGCALPQMQPYCNYCYPSNCDCTTTTFQAYDHCATDQGG